MWKTVLPSEWQQSLYILGQTSKEPVQTYSAESWQWACICMYRKDGWLSQWVLLLRWCMGKHENSCTGLRKAWLLQGRPSESGGFDAAWLAPHPGSLCFQQKSDWRLLPTWLLPKHMFLFYRHSKVVQSYFTQWCKMTRLIWTGHRKQLCSISWLLDLYLIAVSQEWAEVALNWAAKFEQLIFLYLKYPLLLWYFQIILKQFQGPRWLVARSVWGHSPSAEVSQQLSGKQRATTLLELRLLFIIAFLDTNLHICKHACNV